MAGVATGESSVERSTEGVSSDQRCQASEALVEWRSSEQVENETPSTSPPYWDSDDDVGGAMKPSELYGKYTWKIDKFSQINKRELKSNAFEVGGYKWYILIYPQGCDVCNHLSLFLCVANHDKLLPGWSHFAQFTIAVVNKDPKKSKYSDTLHRFWKKEHDWGWKKFMELSKVLDGFIDSDTLIIKAQVQVIRERADRPFRCLDCQYRRELVRVYLTNVEQICRRFVEERRAKLGKLIDDKTRWSSFRAFWLGMDQNSRRRMSREKTESILKVLVKHFFIEKEVTSTLVMDSLYSGLKALEGQHKGKKIKDKHLEAEELPIAIVKMEKDSFLLVDDVLTLLERAAMEPLPPKDEKGPQNRTKDGSLGEEFNKDSIERDERRLTELGRRTIEIFILAHIFSKIEVAYQEAVALKRQEELIREEEAAWLAEIEQKARRGAVDKEKKSKKKQAKQKRNNRKGKDKGRDDKNSSITLGKIELDIHTAEGKEFSAAEPETILKKFDAVEDVSDVSDSVEDASEVHPPTEASSSGVSGLSSMQNGTEERTSSVVDDSSSTCSSDSVPFVAINGSHRGNSRYNKNQKPPGSTSLQFFRGSNHQSKVTSDQADCVNAEHSQPSKAVLDRGHPTDASRSAKAVESLSQVADRTFSMISKNYILFYFAS
ncbi:math domain-containing protein at5g43560 [Phtheirospermum japonicum]|uniref:Math domain-containing protein at5g43560 n=1 Tax=Phtheirospermum japonicum TaxID=374723 RepID=A0A830C9C0_9LAMI|nr:math domain-containing protein at5g43560 [Phtheirospermum japonicum]